MVEEADLPQDSQPSVASAFEIANEKTYQAVEEATGGDVTVDDLLDEPVDMLDGPIAKVEAPPPKEEAPAPKEEAPAPEVKEEKPATEATEAPPAAKSMELDFEDGGEKVTVNEEQVKYFARFWADAMERAKQEQEQASTQPAAAPQPPAPVQEQPSEKKHPVIERLEKQEETINQLLQREETRANELKAQQEDVQRRTLDNEFETAVQKHEALGKYGDNVRTNLKHLAMLHGAGGKPTNSAVEAVAGVLREIEEAVKSGYVTDKAEQATLKGPPSGGSTATLQKEEMKAADLTNGGVLGRAFKQAVAALTTP
jgi:hypothetical protein